MNKRYSKETIRDLKIKVKDFDGDILSHYNSKAFMPFDSINFDTELLSIVEINPTIVQSMIEALDINKTEFESGKILYEHLKLMSPRQASDIGFWNYLNHNEFYTYIAKRWNALWSSKNKISNSSKYIIDHWIQTSRSQGDLMRYSLSGLWWSFYLTIDLDNQEDIYHLTKIFFMNDTLRLRQLGLAKFARHKPAIHAVLEFIKENELQNHSLEKVSNKLIPYINLLGGIRPLSYFEKDWFKQKLYKEFDIKELKGERKISVGNKIKNMIIKKGKMSVN